MLQLACLVKSHVEINFNEAAPMGGNAVRRGDRKKDRETKERRENGSWRNEEGSLSLNSPRATTKKFRI